MEAMREKWTDGRLDDLNHRVDEGFNETRHEFRALRLEMRTEFAAVRTDLTAEIGGVRAEARAARSELSGQIAQLHRTILQLFGGMMATFVIGVLAILTQL
jgi:hypothetical protein